MYYDKQQINIGKALGKREKGLPGAWPRQARKVFFHYI